LRPCIAVQPPQHLYPSQSGAGVAQRVDPSTEPAWPNESMPWRVVPTCTSRRQRWHTCPSLVGTCPDASLPFTRSCCRLRHALPYASVAIALVVALAVTVAVDFGFLMNSRAHVGTSACRPSFARSDFHCPVSEAEHAASPQRWPCATHSKQRTSKELMLTAVVPQRTCYRGRW
jgi:hypothetical protein